MRRRGAIAAMILTSLATVLVLAGASDAGSTGTAKKTIKLRAALSGANEVPPADPDGSGTANVKLKKDKGKVCFKISFSGIENPIMGHIHQGPAGVNGEIKVLFFDAPAGVASPVSGCVEAKRSLIKKIAKHPNQWYVNLHTPGFPSGAIRGQLAEGGAAAGGGNAGGGGGTGGGYPY
jgi:CHRD domain